MQSPKKNSVFQDEKLKKFLQISNNAGSIDNIWNQSLSDLEIPQENVPLGEFEVVDSSIKGYGLHIKEQQKIAAIIGDIIGILSESGERIDIGIICRISKPDEDRIKFGIDLIGMECKPVYLTSPKNTDSVIWALFLSAAKGLKQADSIVFKSNTFSTGEFVYLHQGNKKIKCRLKKLLHSTSEISHVELYYPQDL